MQSLSIIYVLEHGSTRVMLLGDSLTGSTAFFLEPMPPASAAPNLSSFDARSKPPSAVDGLGARCFVPRRYVRSSSVQEDQARQVTA